MHQDIYHYKWTAIPGELREKILSTVWCSKCLDTIILDDYTVIYEEPNLIISGTCPSCGTNVCRIIVDE